MTVAENRKCTIETGRLFAGGGRKARSQSNQIGLVQAICPFSCVTRR
jgi:hypothetical protein